MTALLGQEKGEGWLWAPVGRLGVHGYLFLGRHRSLRVSVCTGGGVGVDGYLLASS